MEQTNEPNILRSHVDQIEKEVKILEKERESLQNNCLHKEGTFVAFDETNSMKKHCSTCKKELGYPTKEEAENFLGKTTKNGNS